MGYGGPHAAFFATREALRPAGAGPDHRRLGRRARPHGVPHGAADARAAHPPREGDVEHLHGAGAARQHRRLLRRVSRPGRADGDRRAASTRTARRRRARADGARRAARSNDAYFDTLCVEGADTVARPHGCAEARGINFRYRDDGTISIALDETTSRQRRRRRSWRCSPRRSARPRRRSRSRPARRAAIPPALGADVRVPDASGVQHASLRDGDDALHPQPRAQGHRPRHVDDSARLVHDEAERGVRDAADHLAGVLAACIRSRRSSRRRAITQIFARARGGALRDHRLRRRVAAAELRRAGRVRRPDGDPRLSPRSRRRRRATSC